MLHRERGLDVAADRGAVQRCAFRPCAVDRGGAGGARRAARSPARRRPFWAIIRTGSIRILRASSGEERGAEGAALASRAPLDMRVNTLKVEREEVLPRLAHLHAEPTRWSPIGLRIRLAAEAKSPAIHAEPCFRKGAIEIQDEGSQLAALFAGAKPGEQVIDLAAGAGGKTLALAAVMENRGQIYATDIDKRQLAPIHERIARAGARNIQVRTPRGDARRARRPSAAASILCSSTRLAPEPAPGGATRTPSGACARERWRSVSNSRKRLLDRAAALVKAGGRIAYVTCSVLAEENGDQVRAFLSRHPDFAIVPPREIVAAALGERAMLFLHAALVIGGGPADDAADAPIPTASMSLSCARRSNVVEEKPPRP